LKKYFRNESLTEKKYHHKNSQKLAKSTKKIEELNFFSLKISISKSKYE